MVRHSQTNPILFAGTRAEYSNNAMHQLIKITPTILRLENHGNCLNFKCPYQAIVMDTFDKTNSPIV